MVAPVSCSLIFQSRSAAVSSKAHGRTPVPDGVSGELQQRLHAEIETAEALRRMVDLREDGAVRMGIPTDAHRASRQSLGRAWSVAFYEHPDTPDGII